MLLVFDPYGVGNDRNPLHCTVFSEKGILSRGGFKRQFGLWAPECYKAGGKDRAAIATAELTHRQRLPQKKWFTPVPKYQCKPFSPVCDQPGQNSAYLNWKLVVPDR